MAGFGTTEISGIVKRVYDDYVERMQNLKHRSIDEVGKSLKSYSPAGEGYFGSINDYGNESVGAINESEQFRTIDSENYVQWKVTPRPQVAPIEFTGLAAAVASTGGEEAFASSVVDALDQARERLLSDENRQFFGLGTGLLALPTVSVTAAATALTVDSAQYLRKNMVVDIFNGATKTVDSFRITAVDKQNNTISFGVSLGVAVITTDAIVKENIRDSAPSEGKEMMGLRGIVDDGTDVVTLQNIDSSANDIWQSVRIDAASANLTSDILQRLLDDVETLGGEESDLIITHHKQRRKYLDLVVPQKRYQTGKLDTGHTEVTFNGRRMLLDKDCQIDTLYAVKKSMLRKFELAPMAMGGHDGSDKFLRTSNKDVFQAYWRHYCNFGTSKRNAHGKLIGLATPSGIDG